MDTTTLTKTSRRLLGGELLEKGYSPQEVADITGAHIRTVFLWKQKIKQTGSNALIVTNHGGRPSKPTVCCAQNSSVLSSTVKISKGKGSETSLLKCSLFIVVKPFVYPSAMSTK